MHLPHQGETMCRHLGLFVILSVQLAATHGACAQAVAEFSLIPLGGTHWNVRVKVLGDTSGLSAFSLDVFGTNDEVSQTAFSFEPKIKGLNVDAGFAPSGFQAQLAGLIGDPATSTHYSAAAAQDLDDPVFGVGIEQIDIPNPVIPNNDIFFGVPAVLGIIDTPVELMIGANSNVPIVNAAFFAPGGNPQQFLTADNSRAALPPLTGVPPFVTSTPPLGSTIDFGTVQRHDIDAGRLASAFAMRKVGSNFEYPDFVRGFQLTGPGAEVFDLAGFVPDVLLETTHMSYDVLLDVGATPGDYEAQLSIETTLGPATYHLRANLVPESATAALGCAGGLLATRRRRVYWWARTVARSGARGFWC